MPSVTGLVSAAFIEAEGRTRLSDRIHTYPLKIAKAFPFEEGQLGVYVMDASPGIMSGDHYELNWRFGPDTKVYITNQSYTKVHPARFVNDDSAAVNEPAHASALPLSEQKQTLRLERGSYVEYMPEPLMLYKDAVFSSETEVWMEPGSALIFSDVVCPGRTQRGEIFQYIKYQNKLTVTYDGELIFASKQKIEPEVQLFRGIGGWAQYTHSGSLYVFYDAMDGSFADALRQFVDESLIAQFGESEPSIYYGLSRSYKNGLVLSVMGRKVYEIQAVLDKAWQHIRQVLFNKPPLQVRK